MGLCGGSTGKLDKLRDFYEMAVSFESQPSLLLLTFRVCHFVDMTRYQDG